MTLIPDIFPKLLNPEYLIIYMSEKSIFRGPFDTQHVKQPQRLLQSERQHHYDI